MRLFIRCTVVLISRFVIGIREAPRRGDNSVSYPSEDTSAVAFRHELRDEDESYNSADIVLK